MASLPLLAISPEWHDSLCICCCKPSLLTRGLCRSLEQVREQQPPADAPISSAGSTFSDGSPSIGCRVAHALLTPGANAEHGVCSNGLQSDRMGKGDPHKMAEKGNTWWC